MEDKIHKEKLEQELSFLKESFEAEVISKEEFEKGKERIERKIHEIESGHLEKPREDSLNEPALQELSEKPTEQHLQEAPEKPSDGLHAKETKKQISNFDARKESRQKSIKKEPAAVSGQKSSGKFLKYSISFVILIIIAFFSYGYFSNAQAHGTVMGSDQKPSYNAFEAKSSPNPKAMEKINVTVINDRKDCFNCDTGRILGILGAWFLDISVNEIDYNTYEGRLIAEKFALKTLPSYILDEGIEKIGAFGQIGQIFAKKGSSYVLGDDASGSPFYFRRESIPNKIDLFIIKGDNSSIKAEGNLKMFLEDFKEINYSVHDQKDPLTKELGIKSFPTFLLNNRIKFSGVQTPSTIMGNFCRVNNIEECAGKNQEMI